MAITFVIRKPGHGMTFQVVAAASAKKSAAAGVLARSEARTERTAVAGFFAGRGATVFSQAGVVAPPDSLTGETSSVSNFARFYS